MVPMLKLCPGKRFLIFQKVLFLALSAFLGACVSVPGGLEFTHNGAPLAACEEGHAGIPEPEQALDPDGFTLATWNIYKGKLSGWREDLQKLYRESDIVLLQEARLDPGLLKWLARSTADWSMAHAFTFRNHWTGVLTAARVPQATPCAQRYVEPHLRLPKTVLISYFPFMGSKTLLLVVNMHGVNFTLDGKALAEQLQAFESVVERHPGPVILAGDLNTWSSVRMNLVEEFARRHGLKSVKFERSPATHFGNRVDHVYYRGLVPLQSRVIRVDSSDHYPLVVRFKRGT